MPPVREAEAQADGAVAGRVRDDRTDRSLASAEILLDEVVSAVTDTTGNYRIIGVRPGVHKVAARLIGYRGVVLDSVVVRAGATIKADFGLEATAVELAPLVVTAPVDELLDPLATASEQKITAADLRNLPVSSLEEAIALSAGSVGTSYRGGRVGEESFILDGLGVKNQLDASSGGLGLSLPPDFLGEASLITNGFSARYGQALSGLVNVVTRDPDQSWEGRVAYETDRPAGGSLDRGLDRDRGARRRAHRRRSRPGGCVGRRRPLGWRRRQRPGAGQRERPASVGALSPAAQQRRAVERRGQTRHPGHLTGDGTGAGAALGGPAAALRPGLQIRLRISPRHRACAVT